MAAAFFLRDEMRDELLWKHSFDVKKSAAKDEVRSVVEVINRIYNEETQKALTSMKAFLTSGGCRVDSRVASSEREFPADDEALDDPTETSNSETSEDSEEASSSSN